MTYMDIKEQVGFIWID